MATKRKAGSMAGKDRLPEKSRTSPAHHSFIYKIGILRRLLDRYSGPTLTQQSGLTLAEWRVLTNLYSSSPTTSRQLCLRLRTDKAEVSRACAGLIKRGYASSRVDRNDRRSALIVITPRGERLHDAIVPLRQAQQKELEVPLSKAEVAELHRILDTLMQYVAGLIRDGPSSGETVPGKRPRARRRPRRRRAGERSERPARQSL
jgi:DNA-binding MarR family transcriptional regulator